MEHPFLMFLDHTQRRSTVGRTPGRVISSSQRPLPDNTRHSQQINIHAPGEIRTHDLSGRAAWGSTNFFATPAFNCHCHGTSTYPTENIWPTCAICCTLSILQVLFLYQKMKCVINTRCLLIVARTVDESIQIPTNSLSHWKRFENSQL